MTTEKFYFIRNGQQIGPIEAEQLARENITPQTMVWRQGMEDWKEARLLPELDFLWQNNANNGASGVPPFQAPPSQQSFASQNNTPYNIYANGGIPPQVSSYLFGICYHCHDFLRVAFGYPRHYKCNSRGESLQSGRLHRSRTIQQSRSFVVYC